LELNTFEGTSVGHLFYSQFILTFLEYDFTLNIRLTVRA
jgi:hypothetical protein